MTAPAQIPGVSADIAALFATVASGAADNVLPHTIALRERRRRELAQARPGKFIENCGVYIGNWRPKDENGRGIGPMFNVLATVKDLSDDTGKKTFTYPDACAALSVLNAREGYDTRTFDDDKALTAAIRDGSYDGGWIIPPYELLEYMGALTNWLRTPFRGGILRDTFCTNGNDQPDGVYPAFYWSSTVIRDNPVNMWTGSFLPNGVQNAQFANDTCRPLRLLEEKL